MPDYKKAFEILNNLFVMDLGKNQYGDYISGYYIETIEGDLKISKKEYEILKKCLEEVKQDA